MGRPGRYTLSVMVWVAAYAAWSAAAGLVIGALSGEAGSASTPAGISALLYVVLPAAPTLVALWFNDWAREGFPSAKERRHGDYRRADRTLRDLPGRSGVPHQAGPLQPAEAQSQAAQPPSDAR